MNELINVLKNRIDKLKCCEIAIYDFDGTLVDTPPKNAKNIKKIEELTGKKVRGWWGQPESLHLKLPMKAKDVVENYKQDLARCPTFIMTGRHLGLRGKVEEVLDHLNIPKPDKLLLSDKDTLQFKLEQIKRLHSEYPNAKITMWEDRIEHIIKFLDFGTKKNIPIEITYVKSDLSESKLEPLFSGVMLTEESVQILKDRIPPRHEREFYHHMTIEFKPSLDSLDRFKFGELVTLKVRGYAADKYGQAILVEGCDSKNDYPHVTLSTSGTTSAAYSNELLKRGARSINPFFITGYKNVEWRHK